MKQNKKTVKYYVRQNIMLSLIVSVPFFVMVVLIIQARTFQIGGEIIPAVKTSEKVVALTFDDGPEPPHSDDLLKILNEHDVKATFFVIGLEMLRYPEATRRLAESGHELGNHSFSHNSLVFMLPRSLANEVEKTDALIRQSGYIGPIPFRPPYMHKFIGLPAYLAKRNRPVISADISLDQNGKKDRTLITSQILERVKPGSILLFHAMYDHTTESRAALPEVISQLKDQGYKFVTISELLTYQK